MKNPTENKSEKYGLPHNRWQVFADRVKTHFGKFLLCGVILLIFSLPLFAVRMYADMSVASLYDKYKQGLFTSEEYNGSIATITLVASSLNVGGFLILAVGLSGLVRQVRQMAWSEPIEFWQDFAVGVKQNVAKYLIVFAVLGLLNAFDSVVMQIRTDVLSYIPLCVYLFVIFPIALHMLVQISIYNHKPGDIFVTSAYFEFHSFYIFRVFFAPFCFGRRFFAPSFFLPKIHFAAIPHSFFFFTKTIENGNFPLKLHFEPFTLFTASVVGCNRVKKRQEIFQSGKKPSGLSFRISIVIWKSDLPVQKILRFFQINSQSRKNLASLKFTLNQKPKRSRNNEFTKSKNLSRRQSFYCNSARRISERKRL